MTYSWIDDDPNQSYSSMVFINRYLTEITDELPEKLNVLIHQKLSALCKQNPNYLKDFIKELESSCGGQYQVVEFFIKIVNEAIQEKNIPCNNENTTALSNQLSQLLNKEHSNFCPELEAAIKVGLHIYELSEQDFAKKGAQSRIEKYLQKNYKTLITRNGKNNEELINRIAKICTPQKRKTR